MVPPKESLSPAQVSKCTQQGVVVQGTLGLGHKLTFALLTFSTEHLCEMELQRAQL